jgi:hypothetical protein
MGFVCKIMNERDERAMSESEYIEELRCKLINLAVEKGSFLDANVLELSQMLDYYLVHHLRRQKQRRRIS